MHSTLDESLGMCECDENYRAFNNGCTLCYGLFSALNVDGECLCSPGFMLDRADPAGDLTGQCVLCGGVGASVSDGTCETSVDINLVEFLGKWVISYVF